MGDDRDDEAPQWLPPIPGDRSAGSTLPPDAHQSGPTGPSKSNGKATTSLILGIVGLLICPWVLSILALVYGHKARKEIDGSGGRYANRSVATAGIVLGWIGIAYAVFATIYLVDRLDTPDNDGNGVPDGIENAVIFPVLAAGARAFTTVLFS